MQCSEVKYRHFFVLHEHTTPVSWVHLFVHRSSHPHLCRYACQMANMISQWRSVWSIVPGTTDASFPFGLVTLADGTDEGHGSNMANFRYAQTMGLGVLPARASTVGCCSFRCGLFGFLVCMCSAVQTIVLCVRVCER